MVLRFFFIPITGGTNAILMRLKDAMKFGLLKCLAIVKMLVSWFESVNSRCEFSVSWFDFVISLFDFVISWFVLFFRLVSGGLGLALEGLVQASRSFGSALVTLGLAFAGLGAGFFFRLRLLLASVGH